MKPYLALAVLAFAFLPQASTGKEKPAPTQEQLCEIEGSLAKVVMDGRQLGFELSGMLKMVKTAPGGSREMVLQAYEEPRYSTKAMQQRTITDFADNWLLRCLRAIPE